MLFSCLDVRGHRGQPSMWMRAASDALGWNTVMAKRSSTTSSPRRKWCRDPDFDWGCWGQNKKYQTLYRESYLGCQRHCSDCLNRISKITVDLSLLKRCSLQVWKEMWVANFKCCIWIEKARLYTALGHHNSFRTQAKWRGST